ncbi:MAG: hypothetical protein CMJ89_09695 [Planctomycetes bacterium]|nr:hypothetical protein [Planctomycetota bacterium]
MSSGSDRAVWSTDDFSSNPNADVLRWETPCNFGFEADAPSEPGFVRIGLFEPGPPRQLDGFLALFRREKSTEGATLRR